MKIPHLAISRLELEKTIVMIDFCTFSLSKCDISCKKFFFLNLEKKLSFLGIFRLEFQKTIVIFEISTLQFV